MRRPGDLVRLANDRDIAHLERLILDRTETVICWREGCKTPTYCQDCRWFKTAAAA